MRSPAELDPLYLQAGRVTAVGSRSFHLATRFFPPEMARAAHAVYWYCRYSDDLVDECANPEQGRRDLEVWAQSVETALATKRPEHPVLRVFVDTVDRYQIPRHYPLELLEGMRMDLNCARYRSFCDLRVFCYRVASIVGLMMCHIIGFRPSALDYAIDLGIAMQLTNILRDIEEDLERGRIYLPADELLRFGYLEKDLHNRLQNDAFHRLMRFQVSRAREFYDRAAPGIALLNANGRFAVQIAMEVYREILNGIERSDYAVLRRRIVVSKPRKYWITACALVVHAARRVVA